MLTIDVVIATYKSAGIQRLAQSTLPAVEGVRYVVNWQRSEDAPIPDALERPDIAVYRSESIGLSVNRNEGLAHATADVVVIADDDVDYYADGLQALRRAYETHPEADLIAFRAELQSAKVYPAESVTLSKRLPKGYYVSSIELSFRRRTGLRFCPELGINAPRIHSGEDEMLLQSALHRGLKCMVVPLTLCRHDHPSTGTLARLSPGNLRGAGCVIALTYGPSAWLRIPLKAWRVWRTGQASLPAALRFITAGALTATTLRRRNPDSLW